MGLREGKNQEIKEEVVRIVWEYITADHAGGSEREEDELQKKKKMMKKSRLGNHSELAALALSVIPLSKQYSD